MEGYSAREWFRYAVEQCVWGWDRLGGVGFWGKYAVLLQLFRLVHCKASP